MAFTIVLASASPRRKALLQSLAFSVKAIPSSIDETPLEEETPENYVKRVARDKVLAVVDRLRTTQYEKPNKPKNRKARPSEEQLRWVVGADTVVVNRGYILGKPKDNVEAYEMLLSLAGKEHMVLTGFCIFDMVKNKEGIQAVRTAVKFKPMSKAEVEKYVSIGESLDKAGGYAIQGVGGYLCEYIEGSYTNIVGLPLCQVIQMMEEMGAHEVLPF